MTSSSINNNNNSLDGKTRGTENVSETGKERTIGPDPAVVPKKRAKRAQTLVQCLKNTGA